MIKITLMICIVLTLIMNCTPSPHYTAGRRYKGKTPSGLTGKKSSQKGSSAQDQQEKAPVGKILKGMASFYAEDFHGRKTANGETYDMHGLTAAHKTLPFNTWLEVKNLANGRTVIVRVNDRGPYVGNRILDLSYGAAKEIGMVIAGVQEVEIEILR